MSKFQRVRGTRDLFPEDKSVFRWIEGVFLQWSARYGFGEIETPMFESSDVFHRSLGDASDIVHKETYTFEDRGGDSLTLRPEGTAGVARAFVSEGLAQKLPLKFLYSGPMFRYERPQKGRYRQFSQVGVEALGYEHPAADVETLLLAQDILTALGLGSSVKLELNTLGDPASRAAYREKLVQYFSGHRDRLSEDSRMRLEKNPLRILDSKDEGDRSLFAGAPRLAESLNDESRRFFDGVREGLTKTGVAFNENDRLVRGLDYYCHTVFEFTTDKLGAQGTVLAGGRYDGLIEMMGGPRTPGVGWAAGLDRLVELLPQELKPISAPIIALVPADEAGEGECLKLAHALRLKGRRAEVLLSGNVGKKMKKANGMGAAWALIIGQSEVESGKLAVKNLATGEQTEVPSAAISDFAF